jgi:hypothetical protein
MTRAASRREREQTLEPQGTSLREGPQIIGNAPARLEDPALHEESILTTIADFDSESSGAERNAPRGQGRNREEAEYIEEQEQEYTTAPASIRLPADSAVESASPHFASTSKGKGREINPPSHSKENTRPWERGSSSSQWTQEEVRRQIGIALSDWTHRVEKNTEETRKRAEEFQSLRQMFEDYCARDNERRALSDATDSTRARASRALYAERGSNEGTAEYERRQSARARFEVPQPARTPRIEEEGQTSSPDPRIRERAERTRKYTAQMAESRARANRARPHRRTSGPPTLITRKGVRDTDSDEEPLSLSSDENIGPLPWEQQGPNQRDRSTVRSSHSTDTNAAGQPAMVQPAHNMLDRDYARRSRSAQPQQLVGPIVAQTPRRRYTPNIQPVIGQDDTDHESHMIETLKDHIRESLMGIPNDLPEIKGLRAKLPDPYEGEDDFDLLDRWLQGLLRFLKIHRLTGVDKDRDRVLVTGTSLKGKAERWFSQEVERPTRIIRDWTFESVIIGLYRTFITTATTQQAMQRYMRVKFSRDEGVMAFYRELLMWAGRLAQYPDQYSFKRRLLNGMPAEYKHHLALYEGISAEHSSIDDIVRRARHLEKTLTSLGSGQGTGKQNESHSGGASQKLAPTREKSRPRYTPAKQQLSRSNGNAGAQGQRPAPRNITGDRGRNAAPPTGDRKRLAAPNPVASRGDTSKLTCYKCGKVGHISSDPKCPQYKRPEQRQIFAAQVVDDRSDGEHPITEEPLQNNEENPELEQGEDPDENPEEQNAQEEFPDGSQYEDEQSSYEEYDGYEAPSDYEEPVYIRAISDEAGPSTGPAPINFEDVDWQPRRDAIRERFQRAPWLPKDAWEFTPRDGITHTFGCEICAKYKEHQIIAEAIGDASDSSAWKIRGTFEQDLIRLGWDLAHEHGRPLQQDRSALETLEQRLHVQRTDLEFQRRRKDQAMAESKELRRLNEQASDKYNDILMELECERFEGALRADEAGFWLDKYMQLQARNLELEELLDERQPNQASVDAEMRITSIVGTPDRPTQTSSLNTGVGTINREEPARLQRPPEDPHPHLSTDAVARLAAARDDNILRDREFRASQNHKTETGERPPSVSKDRRCMAVLLKVNGLEAYALLDSGSTTVSITQDFARVAKVKIKELENPVPLQLGTVGSRSMINFGATTRLELGPITDNDAYLDVVNIDRYDMIVGTPFMRKHGLVLDFEKDTLSKRGTPITTLTAGQEDLMLAKRRTTRAREPTRQPARATN